MERPTLRWGIVGCGIISSRFVSDLCLDRSEASTTHIIQAIGSSSTQKGSAFAEEYCPSHRPSIHDSYDALYADPSVDIVYIGTPHVLHYRNTLDAISAGKHVLCEKPFSLNAREAQEMIDAARKKGVFLMEAVWTRFFPLVKTLQSLLHEEKIIGDVVSVTADFGLRMPISEADPARRTASRALGAGALLDLGIYTLTWASLGLGFPTTKEPHDSYDITASMIFASETEPQLKIDETTCMIIRRPDTKVHALCTASLLYKSKEEFACIYGVKGSISVGGNMASRPEYLVLRLPGQEDRRLDFKVPGFGFHYEADAVGLDIKAGRRENATCPLNTTLAIMKIMDDARAQCGLVYPQEE